MPLEKSDGATLGNAVRQLTSANRHVQVEAPAPGRSVGDDASKEWTNCSADSGSKVHN